MTSEQIIALSEKVLMNTTNRLPIVPVKGKGCFLWDAEGKRYLDFMAGVAVCSLGYGHPRMTYAIAKQTSRLLHASNLYHNEPQARLAERLCHLSFADKVFFCNSGAEANEAAVKLVRKWGKKNKGESAFEIIAMEGSFHGRTLGMISASGQENLKKGYEPLLPGFCHVPFGDASAVATRVGEATCAVMVEPIQGEGGIRTALPSYFKALRDLCTKKRILLIFDEVQTGCGRTGTLFAYEQLGVVPDLMTLAKGLGGGLPIGALLARDFAAEAFSPGDHGATFGGNPLVTFVAEAVLETIAKEKILENVSRTGRLLKEGLEALKEKFPMIREVRGNGLMLGIELDRPAKPFVARCLEKKLLINSPQERVLRFLPSLVIGPKQIEEGLEILDHVFKEAA